MSKTFSQLNTCDDDLKSKFIDINNSFKKKYENLEVDFFICVPGRVNLIGEHIDYNGYNVCPMAIKQNIIGAIKVTDDLNVHISNVNKDKYEDYSCKINSIVIENDPKNIHWYNYVLCGFKGIIEIAFNVTLKGLIIHLDGTIPPASGLSSSSALVCAAALSLCHVLNMNLSKHEIAELTAKAERYIGTEGGGMDQAIIFNANYGFASRISFDPISLIEFQIPPNAVFVIAQSLVTKNKAASNDFNLRVVECRLSSLIIAKKYGLKNWYKYVKLADTQKDLKQQLENMVKIVRDVFHDRYYTKEEICSILNISGNELEEKFLTKNTKNMNNFKLKDRALHVFEEALRVDKFCKICGTTKSLFELGSIMQDSHSSLRDLYECSHTELDKLVTVCMTNGAFGARLTGAGWGGCVVALISCDIAEEFIESVKETFYSNKITDLTNMNDIIFITKPYSGAAIFSQSIIKNL